MSSSVPLRRRFSRRSLLRGLGAGAALAPFARPDAAWGQAAPPGNLLVFYTPNGHKRRTGLVDAGGLAFDAAQDASGFTLGQSLAPLKPFQSDVAVIRGLNLKTPTFAASHQDICRILTCWGAPGGETSQSQFTAFGPSIDQQMGQAWGQAPLVVAVDPYRDATHWRTVLSWTASGVSAPFTKDHQAVFNDLFGAGASTPAPMAGIGSELSRASATFRSSVANDRLHSNRYVDGVLALEKRIARLSKPVATCDSSSLPPRLSALPAVAAKQSDDKSPDGVADELRTRGQLWMDMIALAFACGKRRVATIQWQGASEGYDPAANAGSPTHHSITSNGAGAASGDRWIAIDTWYANQLGYQLAALKSLGILDRTIVVWVSEISEAHNQLDMVTVVAGGKALGLKLGQYIRYPFTGALTEGSSTIAVAQNPANRSLADLWVTVAQALGVDKPTFGDPKWCAGPLTELRG
jgi:hypothetical protein